jgi:hypothetical protein
MRPITATVGPLTAQSANNIALSQTPGAAGPLTLNGSTVTNGTAVLGNPQRITITTTDSTHTFTVTGMTPTGAVVTEVLTGNGTSATSVLNYAKINSIVINGAATGAVTVGTSGLGDVWIRLDEWANPPVGIQVNVTGTANWTLQASYDDPNSPTNPIAPTAMRWVTTNDTNAVAATGNVQTNFLFTPLWVRVVLNSGTGSVDVTATQYNVVSR